MKVQASLDEIDAKREHFVNKMAMLGIVTLDDLMKFINPTNPNSDDESYRRTADELLAPILLQAAAYYEDQDEDRADAAEAALCIAWNVVKGDIEDEAARAIVSEMSALAYSTLFFDEEYKDAIAPENALSADTRRRLEKIRAAARGLDD
jgi:hypothetical protein